MQGKIQHPLILKHLDQVESLLHEYIEQLFFQLELDQLDEDILARCHERMNDIMQTVGRILKGSASLIQQDGSTGCYSAQIRRIRDQQQCIKEVSGRLIVHFKQLLPAKKSTRSFTNIYSLRHHAQMINVLH